MNVSLESLSVLRSLQFLLYLNILVLTSFSLTIQSSHLLDEVFNSDNFRWR